MKRTGPYGQRTLSLFCTSLQAELLPQRGISEVVADSSSRLLAIEVRAQDEIAVTSHETDVVSSIRLAIAQRLGSDRYELWFRGTRLQLQDEMLRIVAANPLGLNWLRQNFRQAIVEACQSVVGREISVEFRVEELSPPSPRECSQKPSSAVGKARRDQAHACRTVDTAVDGIARRPARESGRRFARLDQLIAGPCNQVAVTAAEMVIRQLGSVTPLYVYGPPGTGKSHLLQGIWCEARRGQDRPRCVYLTAEQFTTYFVQALNGSGLPSFRRRHREVDLLLIEDVQFFAGKRATIQELQYTIDAVLRDGRQLVLSANCSPAELRDLGSDLVNRFCGGLVASVQEADLATRREILRRGLAQRQMTAGPQVIELIAERLPGDVRLLQGAINRLWATSVAWGRPITPEMAAEALEELFQAASRIVDLATVERAVCDMFGVEPQQLRADTKIRATTGPRMLAMWLARRHTRAALSEIGEYFGRRSHSTVIAAQKKVANWMTNGTVVKTCQKEMRIDEVVRQIEHKLRAG